MSKVTSKLQVTVPKMIAEKFRIRPGDEINWVAAGEVIRVEPKGKARETRDRTVRLRLFDDATARQRKRQIGRKRIRASRDRGWKREDLYERGRPR
jgi:AbrB family looped-hinge helix DNA binding protein